MILQARFTNFRIMILNKHKLKFGIIGCSGVAERRFLPALMKSTLAKLEHIGSRTREKQSLLLVLLGSRACACRKELESGGETLFSTVADEAPSAGFRSGGEALFTSVADEAHSAGVISQPC